MNFKSWMQIYNISPAGSNTRAEALEKMAEFAKSFADWRNVFYRSLAGSMDETKAFWKMSNLAKTFGEHLAVYSEAGNRHTEKQGALCRLMDLADDPKDADWTKKRDGIKLPRWMRIFEVSPLNSDQERRAAARIIELMIAQKVNEAENRKKQPDSSSSKM